MTRERMVYLSVAMIIAVVAYFGWKLTARNAYESAEYEVLESATQLEVLGQ